MNDKFKEDKFEGDLKYNYYLHKLDLYYKEFCLDHNKEMHSGVVYNIFFNKNKNKIYIEKYIDVYECCNHNCYYIDDKILDLDLDFDLDKFIFYIENSSPLDYLNI